MTPTVVYVLTILFFLANGDPQVATGIDIDQTNCRIAEGQVVTAAVKSGKVLGFKVVNDCTPASKDENV